MTTVEDLRVALERAVADPPPMSEELEQVLAGGRHVPRRRRRNTFLAGVVVAGAAAAAIAAWSMRTTPEKRTGLRGRYEPAAIQAALEDTGKAELPASNEDVAAVMEPRYACQSAYRYAADPSPDAAALLRRRLASVDRVAGLDLREFTNVFRKKLQADTSFTGAGFDDLIDFGCPPKDRLKDTIRRGGP